MKGKFNMRFNPETKTYKLFSALHKGETVTASQAEKRFGVKNISAEVSRIRQAGFAVYANQRVAGNGVKVTEYQGTNAVGQAFVDGAIQSLVKGDLQYVRAVRIHTL